MTQISLKSLEKLLIDSGIDLSSWSNGNAKTPEHLFEEIQEGESKLVKQNNILIREVSVLCINVFCDFNNQRFLLKEERQEFNDGRVRKRNLDCSLAEKIKSGNDLNNEVYRAIKEELSLNRILKIDYVDNFSEFLISQSYPGLKSKFNKYIFNIEIFEEDFNSNGYIEIGNSGLTTYFVWNEIKKHPL